MTGTLALLPAIFALAALFYWLGAQIYCKDFLLLAGTYHYRIRLAQCVTYVATAVALFFVIGFNVLTNKAVAGTFTGAAAYSPWIDLCVFCIIAYLGSFAFEWTLAKINWQNRVLTASVRLAEVALLCVVQYGSREAIYILPFVVAGLYMRNSKFGVVHGKDFFIACHMHDRRVKAPFPATAGGKRLRIASTSALPNFANAGMQTRFGENFKRFNVCDFGAVPDSC
jgi:hypothetical protein